MGIRSLVAGMWYNDGFVKNFKEMKLFFLSLLSFMLLFSCKEEAIEKPQDLIPESKMEAILYELAVLNGAKGFSTEKFWKKGVLPEAYLYKKYSIDSVQFARSSMYYAAKPERYIAIHKRVEERLEAAKQEAEAAQKINDSLRKETFPKRDSLLLQRTQDTSGLRKTKPR